MLVTYTKANGLDTQLHISTEDLLDVVHNALSAAAAEVHGESDAAATFFAEVVETARDLKLE